MAERIFFLSSPSAREQFHFYVVSKTEATTNRKFFRFLRNSSRILSPLFAAYWFEFLIKKKSRDYFLEKRVREAVADFWYIDNFKVTTSSGDSTVTLSHFLPSLTESQTYDVKMENFYTCGGDDNDEGTSTICTCVIFMLQSNKWRKCSGIIFHHFYIAVCLSRPSLFAFKISSRCSRWC